MPGVWVLGETREQTLELLNIGNELAKKLNSTLTAWIGPGTGLAELAAEHGADEVLVMASPAPDQPLESWVQIIADEAKKQDPDIFLLGGTMRLKEMAARIASRLDTGLCSDCIGLRWDETGQRMEMERMVYGGSGIQTVAGLTRPTMATISPRTFEPAPKSGKTGTIKEIEASPQYAVRVLERKPKQREAGDITGARVIVCVGRGIEKQEDLALAQELAEVLDGKVACTRPIAEELNWLPEETYIGLSGKKVKPDLYIGLGISGQIQHTTGIRDSKLIVAVNRDESAPIFEASDYGIVGDLYQVVPRLTAELKQILKR